MGSRMFVLPDGVGSIEADFRVMRDWRLRE
jgi:hypothetical protein